MTQQDTKADGRKLRRSQPTGEWGVLRKQFPKGRAHGPDHENTLTSNSLQRQWVVSICLGMYVFTYNYVTTINKEKRPQI